MSTLKTSKQTYAVFLIVSMVSVVLFSAPIHALIWQAPIDAQRALNDASQQAKDNLENIALALILVQAANDVRAHAVTIMIYPPPPRDPHVALNRSIRNTLRTLRAINSGNGDIVTVQNILATKLRNALADYNTLWEPRARTMPALNFNEPVQDPNKYYVYKLIIKQILEQLKDRINTESESFNDNDAARAVQDAYNQFLQDLSDNTKELV